MLTYLKLYLEFLECNKSCKLMGVILLMILKVSIAIVLCLLVCSEGILALSRSLSGLHTQNQVLSPAPFQVFKIIFCMQKCHAKGQKLKLLKIKV